VPDISKDDPAFAGDARFEGLYHTRSVVTRGLNLQFTDWPSPSRRVLVLLHGFNVQGHTWDPIARVLQPHFRVLCPDLRGHGGSDWSREGYWTHCFVDDVADLLEQEGIARCDVVGHSLGARVAIGLAARCPDRVSRLMLSDGGPELLRAGTQQSANIGTARLARRGFNDTVEAVALYEEMHPEWLPVFRRLHAEFQLRENWVGKLVERADPELFWITRSAGHRDNAEVWDFARQVKCPTRLLWSETAGFLDETMVARYRAVIPTLTDMRSTAGHYIPRERPWEFCERVLDYLDEDDTAR